MKKYFKLIALLVAACMLFGVMSACGGNSNSVEVSFELNYLGGVGAPPERMVKVGQAYGELPSPARSGGWVFDGWYYNKNTTDGPVTAETKVEINEDHALWAKWVVAPQVKITFDPSDGEFVGELPNGVSETEGVVWRNVTVGGTYLNLPAVKKEGCFFSHWETLKDNNVPMKVERTTPVTITHDHTVYAVWNDERFLWDFSDPSDAYYFVNLNSKTYTVKDGESGGSAYLSYDATVPAMKIDNTDADEANFDFDYPMNAGYKVTVEISVALKGAMQGPMMLRIDGSYGGTYHVGKQQVVEPESNAWPSANGGKVTVSWTATVDCARLHFLVCNKPWSEEAQPVNVDGAEYYLHKVEITPPGAPKMSYNFDTPDDMEILSMSEWGSNSKGMTNVFSWDGVKQAAKMTCTQGDWNWWINVNRATPAGWTVTIEMSADFPGGMPAGTNFKVIANKPTSTSPNYMLISPTDALAGTVRTFSFTLDYAFAGGTLFETKIVNGDGMSGPWWENNFSVPYYVYIYSITFTPPAG